jgi:hypothetical protein
MRAAIRSDAVSTQQKENQTADAQEEEGDNHAIGCTETWFCGTVGGYYGRFDIIAALTVHSKRKRTHASYQAKHGPATDHESPHAALLAETPGAISLRLG